MAENRIPAPTASPPIGFREATPADRAVVTQIWEACGLTRPWNDPDADFDFALAGPSSTILVGEITAGKTPEIVASVMVGHDGHRGAVYYVSVVPMLQAGGIGRAVMVAAENWLRARDVPKLNLIVRGDNTQALGFYERLGYIEEPNRQLGRRLDD